MKSSFRRNVRLPSPAMIVALAALFVALGGSAFAVSRVGTKQIKKGAVTTAKIRNGAVTNAKLRNGSVTGPKVAAGAIGESDLVDGAVTGDKIAQTTVRAGNMDNRSVPGRAIQDGAVANDEVATGSLGADRLTDAARLSLKGVLAYGLVDFAGPSLVSGSTSGFSGVNRSGPGTYCLTPTPEVAALAIDPGGNPVRPMLVSVEWRRTPSSVDYPFALPNGSAHGSCAQGQYEVHTESPTGVPTNEISFIVAIP